MLYDPIDLRLFNKDIYNTINNISINTNDSLIQEELISFEKIRNKLKNNVDSSNLITLSDFDYPIIDYYFFKAKSYLPNAQINKELYNVTKNPITKNILTEKTSKKYINLYKTKELLLEQLRGLKKDEKINLPNYSGNIFKFQNSKEINERHRKVVIEWLSYINHYFGNKSETLFMSINLMDRYISLKTISLNIYQLVGIGCYLISSKYEDTNFPAIDSLIYVSKNIYTSKDIISMEQEILDTLNYDIVSVSSFNFFSCFYLLSEINNEKLFHLGHLILELCLLNIDIMTCDLSLIAIGAFLIAKKCLNIDGGNDSIEGQFEYKNEEIKNIQKKIVLFLSNIIYSNCKSLILEKYELNKYMSVSHIFKNERKSTNNSNRG